MSADYTGLHGRNPYEQGHTWADSDGSVSHQVPEGWEDLNRGICPECGRTVVWDEEADQWVLDPSLTVLVLTEDEVRSLPPIVDTALAETIDRQYDLNRPFEEV